MNRTTWLLILILLSGLCLRLYGLGTESLWADEGISVQTITASFTEMIQILSKAVHPPLHYLILHGWARLFGDSEFAVRFPSVVFSIVTILMSYRLGSLLFDRTAGIFAALLVSLSLFNIRYAQEARNYSLLCMMGSISYYYFIKMLRDDSKKYSIGYVIASTLLMYTHVYGLFTIIAQNLYVLTRKLVFRGQDNRPSWRHWIGLQTLLAVFFAPWVHILLHHVIWRQVNGSWQPTPTSTKYVGLFVVYAGTPLLFLLCGAIAIAALFLWKRAQLTQPGRPTPIIQLQELSLTNKEPFYLLLVWMGTHTALPFLLSQILTPFYRPRYMIVGSIAFYLLIAKGLQFLSHRKMLIQTAVASLFILTAAGLLPYYQDYNKERWRDAVAYVDTFAQPGDLVVVNAGFLLHTNFNYYSKRTDLIKKEFPDPTKFIKRIQPEHLRELSQFINDYQRVWMVFSHNDSVKTSLRETISQTHTLIDHQQYHKITHVRKLKMLDIEVLFYEREAPRISLQPPSPTQKVSHDSSQLPDAAPLTQDRALGRPVPLLPQDASPQETLRQRSF